MTTRAVSAPRAGQRIAGLLADYVRLTKPRVISLLLLTTLLTMIMAERGWPDGPTVVWTMIGGYLAAGGANAINQWFDRDIDARMRRTSNRPIVAGRIAVEAKRLVFNYGRSYLDKRGSVPIYEPELPLRPGAIEPLAGLTMAGSLRDGAPDAWGRRVIINRLLGKKGQEIDVGQLDELTYLLESSSDRIGALDFAETAGAPVAAPAAPKQGELLAMPRRAGQAG